MTRTITRFGDSVVHLERTPTPLDGTMDVPLDDRVGADQQEMPAYVLYLRVSRLNPLNCHSDNHAL